MTVQGSVTPFAGLYPAPPGVNAALEVGARLPLQGRLCDSACPLAAASPLTGWERQVLTEAEGALSPRVHLFLETPLRNGLSEAVGKLGAESRALITPHAAAGMGDERGWPSPGRPQWVNPPVKHQRTS